MSATKLLSLDFIPAGLKTRIQARLPQILLYLLVIILAYQLAGLTWRVIERYFYEPAKIVQEKSPANPQNAVNKSGESAYKNLSKLHLFGRKERVAVVTKTPETAPETRLNLTLYGVFTDPDVKKGSAIIGQQSGQQQHFYVDDKIGTGVWLAEVRKDHVLLKRGAAFEMLKFPKQASKGVNIQHSAPRVDRSENLPGMSEEKQAFMENVKIIPVFSGKDRKLKGYRLLPKKNRALYNRLGIRPSDIITSINGIALNDHRESMQVIAELVKSDEIEVEISRNGQTENKVISLQ